MKHEGPPPAPPSCLTRPYSSKPQQKGGTLIAEDVHDLLSHRSRLLDPEGYRPRSCPRCRHDVLHAHDHRLRMPRDQPRGTSIVIRRYVCGAEGCGARWQVLPAFLARHLQRSWHTIEEASLPEACSVDAAEKPAVAAAPVPPTTLRRYLSRLSSCASSLRAAFAAVGASVESVLSRLEPFLTRAAFCRAFAEGGFLPIPRRLAALSGWIHRLIPGLRLM